MNAKLILFLSSALLLASCKKDDDKTFPKALQFTYNFQNDNESWEGDFADYPVGEDTFYELGYENSNLPDPLNSNEGALKQTGNNHNDDLFMFIRQQITNLEPDRNYNVSFEIEFASNVADNQVGVGGSPGEGVTIKAGATSIKPEKVEVQSDYRMNIDKANQTIGGSDMMVIGDFSNDTDQNEYTLKTLVAENLLSVKTNSEGQLWLIIGTDSGFEATTTIYYNSITVNLEKQ